MSDTLRSKALRLAASLPKGDPTRQEILAQIKKADLFDAEAKAAKDVWRRLQQVENTQKALIKALDKLHRFGSPREADAHGWWKPSEDLLKLTLQYRKDLERIEDDLMNQMDDLLD